MVYFKTGGKTTKRPYIASSNYIYKMSNYKKDGIWDKDINYLYNTFVKKHKNKLMKYKYYIP